MFELVLMVISFCVFSVIFVLCIVIWLMFRCLVRLCLFGRCEFGGNLFFLISVMILVVMDWYRWGLDIIKGLVDRWLGIDMWVVFLESGVVLELCY